MTRADAERALPNWTGYAFTMARAVPRPVVIDAEDWAAETLYALAVALRRWKPRDGQSDGAIAPWIARGVRGHLRRIARNATTIGRGSGKPSTSLDDHAYMDGCEGSRITRHELIAGPAPDPADVVAERDLIERVRAADLTPRERQVLEAYLSGECESDGDVARKLGVSPQAVCQARHRLARTVRAVLDGTPLPRKQPTGPSAGAWRRQPFRTMGGAPRLQLGHPRRRCPWLEGEPKR